MHHLGDIGFALTLGQVAAKGIGQNNGLFKCVSIQWRRECRGRQVFRQCPSGPNRSGGGLHAIRHGVIGKGQVAAHDNACIGVTGRGRGQPKVWGGHDFDGAHGLHAATSICSGGSVRVASGGQWAGPKTNRCAWAVALQCRNRRRVLGQDICGSASEVLDKCIRQGQNRGALCEGRSHSADRTSFTKNAGVEAVNHWGCWCVKSFDQHWDDLLRSWVPKNPWTCSRFGTLANAHLEAALDDWDELQCQRLVPVFKAGAGLSGSNKFEMDALFCGGALKQDFPRNICRRGTREVGRLHINGHNISPDTWCKVVPHQSGRRQTSLFDRWGACVGSEGRSS